MNFFMDQINKAMRKIKIIFIIIISKINKKRLTRQAILHKKEII